MSTNILVVRIYLTSELFKNNFVYVVYVNLIDLNNYDSFLLAHCIKNQYKRVWLVKTNIS